VLSAQAVVSELKSSFHEYAPMASRFKPSSPATIKLTHYRRLTAVAPARLAWYV
jgi:hypothetical protein